MTLRRPGTPEMSCPLLTETARLWHCPLVPAESYPVSRLAGRLDSSLDFSAGRARYSSHSGDEEQALDLRVRRRADSLDRSPSPTESESTTVSPGRSPLGGSHTAYRRQSTGLGSPAGSMAGSPVSSLFGSPPSVTGTPSSPPALSYMYYSPVASGSVCSSPPQFGSVCGSPPSPGSPERAARGRQTSVIRRLVLDRPTTGSEPPQSTETPVQQDYQQQPQQHQPQKQEQQQPQQQPQPQQHPQQQPQQPQPQHPCDQCGRKYSTASNLARHRQLHCLPSDKKARKCPECDKVYVSMPAYSMHVRTHSQGCRCPYCGKAFSRPWLLQGHVRTHTGERPFRCSVCAKAFADKSNLRAHVQTHSNVKPHVCQRCGKAFALKSYLYKHEESSCMKERRNSRGGKEASPKVKAEMQGVL
ncbi:zinc finger protein SNAI2-like [Amphibalanus amphitrite]|uniref:zinc finger protein SNAI2-like n=1 Tax=Amphibalanus amphitrite TaxID=1232801 RepID=UPI001C8FD26D|nr:zinc finger protein SNAI2-like [Amphibalanus amphitrite]